MSLYKRNSIWWSSVFVDGVRHCISTGTSNRRKAEAIERNHRDKLNDERHHLPHANPGMTFGELAAQFIGSGMSTRYSRDRLKHLLAFFSDSTVRDLNVAATRQYRQERYKANDRLKAATVNRDLSVLRRALNWGVEESLIAVNPLGRLRLERERRTKRPILSVREEMQLMAHAPDHLRRIICCALDTGMRRGEMLSQRWEDVDLDNRLLHVSHSKTPGGESRIVPLTNRLYEVLLESRQSRGYVFTYGDNPIKIVKTSWASSLRRAGLRHVRLHDLRHTANTRMTLAGVLQEVRREILGHSLLRSRDTNDRYTQIGLRELRDAIHKLDVWLATETALLGNETDANSREHATTKTTEGPTDERTDPERETA